MKVQGPNYKYSKDDSKGKTKIWRWQGRIGLRNKAWEEEEEVKKEVTKRKTEFENQNTIIVKVG